MRSPATSAIRPSRRTRRGSSSPHARRRSTTSRSSSPRPTAGGAQPVTSNAVFDSAPAWSPDGSRIAIERGPQGDDPGNDIWTIASGGGDERQITATAGLDEGPAYAPGGTRIAFASRRGGTSDIWSAGAAGDDPRPIVALGRRRAIGRLAAAACAAGRPPPSAPPPPTPRGQADDLPHGVAAVDRDGDGLSAARERALRSSPIDRDSDDDGLSDGVEVRITRTRPARRDTDRDGLTDGQERGVRRGVADPPGVVRGTDVRRLRVDRDPRTRTDPRRRDTDRDGFADGVEDRNRNGRRDRGERSPLGR